MTKRAKPPQRRKAVPVTPSASSEPIPSPHPPTLSQLARTHTLEAIQTLAEIMMHSDDEKNRVSAAKALLERAWGRPGAGPKHSNPETSEIGTGPDVLESARQLLIDLASRKVGGMGGPGRVD
jgi:hypothetical protein